MRDALLLLAFCFLTYPKLLAQPSGASIEGTVVDSVSAAPLSGVHVHLELVNPDEVVAPVYGSVSNDAGHFSMAGIQPGVEYRLQADLPGYLLYPTVEQAPNAAVFRTFKPGERVREYKLEMARRVIITGRVIDENGDGVAHATVAAQRVPQRLPTHSGVFAFGSTDDRGMFRLAVIPERYNLVASWTDNGQVPEIRTDGSTAASYLPTYYPSAASRDSASVVNAQAGSNVSGIEIRMIRSATLQISGSMGGVPPDALGREIVLRNQTTFMERVVYPKADGKFSFSPLDAGTYQIYGQATTNDGPMRSPVMEVTLTTASVDLGPLPLGRGFDLRGQLSGLPPAGRIIELTGVQTSTNAMPSRGGAGSVAADGSFTIKGVQPGEYEVRIEPFPDTAYVKSLHLGEAEAEDSVLDLRRGSTSALLNVTVGQAGAQVSGVITDANGQPIHRKGYVAVVLDGKDLSPRHRHGEETDQDGAYTVRGLAPGKYRIVATVYGITEYPADEAARAAAMHDWVINGDLVEVHEAEKLVKNVKVAGAK